MGLSRWQFTREFKLAAVRRLEMGCRSPRWRGRLRSTPMSCITRTRNLVRSVHRAISDSDEAL